MDPLKIVETSPGSFSLLLNAGDAPVDETLEDLGYEPSGYFWEGIARFLVKTNMPDLESAIAFDPEAGMFCAYGTDRFALDKLGVLLAEVANDPEMVRDTVQRAKDEGYEFED